MFFYVNKNSEYKIKSKCRNNLTFKRKPVRINTERVFAIGSDLREDRGMGSMFIKSAELFPKRKPELFVNCFCITGRLKFHIA